jgi:hypothetical protein
LPKWPSQPFLRPPVDHAGFFLTAPDADGRTEQWGYREFVEESQDYIRNQVPGTHESRSAEFLLASIAAQTGQLFQLQDTPGLTGVAASSVAMACMTARALGCGTTGFAGALHYDGSTPPTSITGGAFSSDNYKNGVITFHGVTADEVLVLLRGILSDFIRKGGIVE